MAGPRIPHQEHAADERLEVQRTPPPGGRLLTWIAAIVGVGVLAGLAFVAIQIVGSITSRDALEEAERNLLAPGVYAVTADATAAGDDLEVALNGVTVTPDAVEAAITWTNTGSESIVWDCRLFAAPRLTWYAESIDLDAYASPERTPLCDSTAEAPVVAPGDSRSEVHVFARDGSWGAGAVRLFSDTGADGVPTAEFTLDLDAAART